MSFTRVIASTVLGAAALLATSQAHAVTNLITDPTFSTSPSFVGVGYLPASSVGGWTATGSANSAGIDGFTGVGPGGNFWNNGNIGSAATPTTYVGFIQDGGALTSNTFSLTAGTTYTVDFFENSRAGAYNAGNITATIAGATLTGNSFAVPAVNTAGLSSNEFVYEQFTFTAATSVASTALVLSNLNTTGVNGDTTALVDDVFVTPNSVAAVPEPGSMALLGAGLLGMIMVARRRRV